MTHFRAKHTIMHAEDARYVFIHFGGQLWLRAQACVAVVACPNCKSKVGQPCIGKQGLPLAYVHCTRRWAAKPTPTRGTLSDCGSCGHAVIRSDRGPRRGLHR